MNYEYTITCLCCASLVSKGMLGAQASLSPGDILANAVHNPGCKVPRNTDPNKTPTQSTITVQGSTTITQYSIQYLL